MLISYFPSIFVDVVDDGFTEVSLASLLTAYLDDWPPWPVDTDQR